MQMVVGGRARDAKAASTSEMARFETKTLNTKGNLSHLSDVLGQWIDQAHRTLTKLILGMDSSVSETYCQQEGAAYNGHCECTCYHPVFVFTPFGDLERVILRRGNHSSAKYWRWVLLSAIERYRGRDIPGSSAGTLHSPCRSCSRSRSDKSSGTPSGSCPTPYWSRRLPAGRHARWVDRRLSRRSTTTTFLTGLGLRIAIAGWWSRLRDMPVSSSRGWVSSSPT